MKFKEHFHTEELENITEDIVFEQLHLLIESGEEPVPTAESCLQDIAAITLNRLKPKYAVCFIDKVNPRTERLDELMELEKQARKELLRAIKIVRDNPHHR